jgi:hypothetical protein
VIGRMRCFSSISLGQQEFHLFRQIPVEPLGSVALPSTPLYIIKFLLSLFRCVCAK